MTTHTQDIIHRLLNGDCSDQDLEQLKANKEAAAILNIIHEAGNLDLPDGLSMEEAWDRISAQMNPPARIRTFRPLAWMVSVAAVILIFALVFWPSASETPSWTAAAGERVDIQLPDGTHAILNAGSTLTVTNDWDEERNVSLEGTALFEVTKGEPFIVSTDQGTVRVLGTRFEVVADEGDYVIKCFEGTVAVTSATSLSDTVTAGEGIRLVGDAWEALQVGEKGPDWIQGITSFENAPIREVLNAYERQFGIEVIYNNDNRKYTGAFPHDNAEDALEMIALPMNLEIESGDSGEIHLRMKQE